MCAQSPDARPSAAEALEALAAAGVSGPASRPERRADYRNLPEGYHAHPQVHGAAQDRQRIVRRGVPGVRQPGGRGPGREDRRPGPGIAGRSPRSRNTRSCYALPPHPNVVRVENADYLDGQDVPYLVFEYLDGKDVSDLVKDRVLGPADTIRLGIDVATGLAFLHANGVYHCDIKPSNLLWTDRGCKIIDFNVAVLSSSSMSRAGGSPRYAPPDISRAAPPSAVDLADRDVYALGVTLYQVLTGQYPFPSGAPALGETAADPRSVARADASCRTPSWTRCCAPSRRCGATGTAAPTEFLAALQAIGDVHRRPVPNRRPLPLPVPATPNVNPFVATCSPSTASPQ